MAAPSRAMEKAKALLQTDFYEAQQMFKSIYHRQRAKKQLKESYETLKEGALLQLQASHVTCGVELGILLVEALTTDEVTPDLTTVQPLLDIIAAFPRSGSSASTAAPATAPTTAPQADDVEEYSRFISAALGWTSKQPQTAWQASQRVHAAYASFLWQRYRTSQLHRLSIHLLRSGDPKLHAQVLQAVSSQSDLDAFLTQAVLQELAIAKPHTKAACLEHAKGLLAACTPQSGSTAQQQPPLVNFLSLLLEAIERRSVPLVQLLRDRYRPLLSCDPAWDSLLDRVESVYLGVKRGGGGAGLQGLLGSLLGGMGPEGPGGMGGGGAGGMRGLTIEELDGDTDEDEHMDNGRTGTRPAVNGI